MENILEYIRSEISIGDTKITESDYNSALEHYLLAASHVIKEVWPAIPVRQKIRALISADIDGDGNEEIFFGTEGKKVFAYRFNGDIFWKNPFETNDWVTGIEYFESKEGGGRYIIVASDKLYVLNDSGETVKSKNLNTRASSLKECKKDGFISVGDKEGKITCYSLDFNLEYIGSFKTDGSVIDIAVGDFDGDGNIEIAAASEDRNIYIIDKFGNLKEKIRVGHWIINMDTIELTANRTRLYVGKFKGETLVYKPGSQLTQSIELSSILDIKVRALIGDIKKPQFIVGSSDRQLSFFDYDGSLIWCFESGLGQRVISVEKKDNGNIRLYIGTESGEVFAYSVFLFPNLVQKIREAISKLKADPMDINLDSKSRKLLLNFIEYDPIRSDASLLGSKKFYESGQIHEAIVSAMETWFNDSEFIWKHETRGRIYDITFCEFSMGDGERYVLAGSQDGMYCVSHDNVQKWVFSSFLGTGELGEIRGVYADKKNADSVIIASADNSIYKLNSEGIPMWNFQHNKAIMFTYAGYVGTKRLLFAGTEDKKVLTFDDDGLLLWEREVGAQIRALTYVPDYHGVPCVIAGSDDSKVNIFNSLNGELINNFSTPHYVLVVHAQDVDGDGNIEILTGNENGHLHVYDFSGNLLWRFETGSWIAALDILVNKESNEVEIVIGSQDCHIYGLNANGALLWQYETAKRVRTLCVDEESNEIAFGSYDKKFYLISRANRQATFDYIYNLYNALKQQFGSGYLDYKKSTSRYERAFAFLFETEVSELIRGTDDNSEIVLAAIGCNIVENHLEDKHSFDQISKVMKRSSRETKAIILNLMSKLLIQKKIRKNKVYSIISNYIHESDDVSSCIDAFRHWGSMVDDGCDVLHMAARLIPSGGKDIDEYIVDELNHACIMAMKLKNSSDNNLTISDDVTTIVKQIFTRYPETAKMVKEVFG